MIKTWLSFCVVSLLTLLPLSAHAQADMLRVGVREDARPFSVWDPETQRFDGFIYDMCNFALRALGYREGVDFVYMPVNASNRLHLTERDGTPRNHDIVCDPTSQTIERTGRFFFSPVVFISGGSFLESESALDAIYGASLAVLDAKHKAQEQVTTHQGVTYVTADGSANVRARNPIPPTDIGECADASASQIIGARLGYVLDTTGPRLIRKALAAPLSDIYVANFQVMCMQGFASHQAAIQALCEGSITHHFGDRDIINSALSVYKTANPTKSCDAALDENIYSSEPYAIAISPELPQARILELQRAILIALSSAVRSSEDDSVAPVRLPEHLFTKHFEGQRMSPALRSLYLQY